MTGRDIEAARLASDLYIAPDVGDVEIRDWRAFEPAVQAGYEGAAQALAQCDDALKARLGLPVRTDRMAQGHDLLIPEFPELARVES
jgi:NTE family protein